MRDRGPVSVGEPTGWAALAADLWQPRDPVFFELRPGGELLASRLRVALAWLLLFAANGLGSPSATRGRTLALCALVLLAALVAHAAISWRYGPWLGHVTVVLDVLSAAMLAEAGRAQAVEPAWALLAALLVAVSLAGLRHQPSLVPIAGGLAVGVQVSRHGLQAAPVLALSLATIFLTLGLERAQRHGALADADPLTGLRRRDAFEDWLRAELQRSQRHAHRLTLCFVEVDGFRELTQRHGAARGTAVQRSLAGVLKRSLRTTDVVARWASGLFALALPETDARTVLERLEQLRAAIVQTSRGGAESAAVGISAGVAAWPDDGPDAAALVASAEQRLRAAREAGGDRLIGPAPAQAEQGRDATT